MKTFPALLPVLGCLLVLAGCAAQPPLIGSPRVTQVEALPPPERADLMQAGRPYYIGALDDLSIDVFGIEELSRKEVQVDASGRISFPLIGALEAGGKTPTELARMIEQGLRGRYIRDPHVTVNLRKTGSQVVTVEGEVREPGLYPVIGHMSLLRAVATAKGTTEFSALESVVVFRTVQGKNFAALYSLKAIRQGAYPDPEIFANDVVVVGDSPKRRLFKDLLSAAPLLTTPLIIALQ